MKSNRCVISKSDYDCYTMHLPVSVILKNRRNKFVSSQLEKMHPCFPKDQCYKSRLRLLREGFVSEVVVMNRFKLDEYRKRYPGKKMWIDDVQETYEDYGKIKILSGLMILFFVVSVLFLISYISVKHQATKRIVSDRVQISDETSLNEKSYLNDIFQIIEFNNGLITQMKWELAGSYEVFDLTLENIYPESFDSVSEHIIVNKFSYNKGMPVLKIYGQKKNIQRNDSSFLIPVNLKRQIRVLLNSENTTLLDENIKNNSFTFRIENPESGFTIFEQLKKIIEEHNCGTSKVAFQVMENQSVLVEFAICCQKSQIDMSLLNQNSKLIKKQKKLSIVAKKEPEPKKAENHLNNLSLERKQKLGEIIRKDGTHIYFYKDSNGKISRELK